MQHAIEALTSYVAQQQKSLEWTRESHASLSASLADNEKEQARLSASIEDANQALAALTPAAGAPLDLVNYSEWLDTNGLLPKDDGDPRTHDDLVTAFLAQRTEAGQ